ncbi:hypothetical protein M8C21_015259 [Ambrosia artemisiifolia]|uniref:PCI domain-containing protein n=1 Tax=Ambrosia artemisiifolia TaxID=4212 RepID=A0AAD5BKK1_AMBAR|nr:hypothetical protein M8C21_015259 [Ambrosia artemisiifolia]
MKRLKEDSLLLLRGFDSVASLLSQLSNTFYNVFQPCAWFGLVFLRFSTVQDVEDDQLKEFLMEVSIMKRDRLPNVVLFMGAVTIRPHYSIVTDYLPRYYSHSNDYLEICRCYKSIYEIPSVKGDPAKWIPVLRKICQYLVLAPHDPMSLLKQLVTMEVIQWTALWNTYRDEFENERNMLGGSLGDKAADNLKERNILVVSKYYARITVKRLAELLCLTIEETKKHLSDMVLSKALVAKVDRPWELYALRQPKTAMTF